MLSAVESQLQSKESAVQSACRRLITVLDRLSILEAGASHLEVGAISHDSSIARSARPSGCGSKRVGAKLGALSSARRLDSGDKRRNRTSDKKVRHSSPRVSVHAGSSMRRSSQIACWERGVGRRFRSMPASEISIHLPVGYRLSESELIVLFGADSGL